jgi:hypothetical protein
LVCLDKLIILTNNIYKMPNAWIEFVKSFASKNGINYRDALKHPNIKAEYQSHKAGSPSVTHPGEKDYTTKKGDKDFHQDHHLVAGTPYKKGGSLGDSVDKFISSAYNATQLGANAGKKFISL